MRRVVLAMVMLSTISCQEGSTDDAGVVCADAAQDSSDAPLDAQLDAPIDAEVDSTPVDASVDAAVVHYCYFNSDCEYEVGLCCDVRTCVPGIIVIGMCIPYD